jgi:hypothetical protein
MKFIDPDSKRGGVVLSNSEGNLHCGRSFDLGYSRARMLSWYLSLQQDVSVLISECAKTYTF